MSEKESEKLIKKFQKLEKELIEILNIEPIKFDDSSSKSEVKKEINGYIKKLKKAKTVFEEYEKVAESIKKLGKTEDTVFDAVLDLRESPNIEESKTNLTHSQLESQNHNDEYENVVQTDELGTRMIRKAKSAKKNSKEFL